ncbi:hypothetical protein Tco_0281494 [Tanacetum coccineum]
MPFGWHMGRITLRARSKRCSEEEACRIRGGKPLGAVESSPPHRLSSSELVEEEAAMYMANLGEVRSGLVQSE